MASRPCTRFASGWENIRTGAGGVYRIVVLETFVERDRFTGTVYRAANWRAVGATTGRTRPDRHPCIQAPVKDIYRYPLQPRFREALQG